MRIEIPSSTLGQDAAFGLCCIPQNPSNGEVIIEMPEFGSGATNFAVASSSATDEFAGDNSESSTEPQVPLGPYLNHSEANNHDDDNRAVTMNPNVSAHDETNFRPEVNTILAAIAGQAAANLISPGSTDSSSVRLFAAASGIVFLGSFFALYFLKKPKLAKVLSTIGAIGTESAVIIALGTNILRYTNAYLKVGGRVATAAACLITAMVVVMAD